MNYTLADVPDHLLQRAPVDHHDLKRAIAMSRWIEGNLPYRPTYWDLHLLRVARGWEAPFDSNAALASIRKRRDEMRAGQPRRQRPSQSARMAARAAAAEVAA